MDFFKKLEGERIVCWFSCGATSAVACKLAITENDGKLPIQVCYCDTRSEHPDNDRFISECEKWLGCEIERLTNPKYNDVNDVIETERYVNGPSGAKCTQQLKIAVRLMMQRPETDYHVYGFDAGEIDRAFDFRERNPEIRLKVPLIDRGLTKPDCLAMLREEGIELPMMYRMGYRNNNCIGCVKGGMGYWNKIRDDFPEVFEKRAKQERMIGHSCIKGVYLDELSPNRGRYESEPDISCEGVCVEARRELTNCEI
jgi:hypothetical protein